MYPQYKSYSSPVGKCYFYATFCHLQRGWNSPILIINPNHKLRIKTMHLIDITLKLGS